MTETNEIVPERARGRAAAKSTKAAGATGSSKSGAATKAAGSSKKAAAKPAKEAKAALPSRSRSEERTEPAELMRTDEDAEAAVDQELEASEAEAEEIEEEDDSVDVEPPDDEMADVSTDDLWDAYRVESDRLMVEMAEELGVTKDSPEVTSRKREITSPELERLRNELIERHYPLVRYIAERLLQTLPKSIELDDLVSAGQFGLMDAIRGFDPDRGIKFKTYCSTRIRGSILDQLRSQDWVPRLVRIKWSRIERALQQLTGEFGREPTHSELAKVLGMTHDELAKELNESQAKAMFSLSEKWDDDEDGAVEKVEVLEDHDAVDPVHELNRRDLMKFITRSLTHKERFIIEQYYQYGHTMREIGEMLALTESRVCQIHSNVMGRLKGLLVKRTESLHN
ncbi:MAG: FliA/WhiG family RNA polymerase sigma factor [Planctomycetota bacterium]